MKMVDTRELARVLREVAEPGADEAVRRRAEQLMAEATPAEVSVAEQMLIEEGKAPEELRAACDIHLKLLDRRTAPLRAGLPEGHVLDTLYKEHAEILGFLDKLDGLAARLEGKSSRDPLDPDNALLVHLAEHLVGAEKHHLREEQVLFPELERRGVDGPPRIMRLEHDQLRPAKRRLLELARQLAGEGGKGAEDQAALAALRREIVRVARFIIFNLRDHIFKEDNILYPTALQTITDPGLWEDMRQRCDRVGYCCFTPGKRPTTAA